MNRYVPDLIIIQNFSASRTRQRTLNEFREIFAVFNPEKIIVYPSQNPEGVSDSIAHVTFANENDAVRAFNELQNKVVYNNETLLLTLTSQDHAPINCLPNECLLDIFSRLPIQDKLKIEEVCTKWERIASKCWTNEKKFYVTQVDLRMKEKTFLECMKRCGPYCNDIEISLRNRYQIPLILEYCKNLNSIRVKIDREFVNEDRFNSLLQLTNKLNITRAMIEIHHNRIPFSFDTFLQTLSVETTEIHIFRGRSGFHDLSLGNFNISKFKNLRALSLRNLNLTEDNLIGFDQLNNLVCLVLRDSRINLNSIKAIKNFTKLEHLSIHVSTITDDILDVILSNNENLEFLNITRCVNITNHSFISLSQHENLRVLNMSQLRNVTFENISAFKNLRCLCCDFCFEITIDGMKRVLENSSNLQVIKAFGVAAIYSLSSHVKSIVRKTESGKTLMPTQNDKGSYMWIESEPDALKATVPLRFPGKDFYDTWFNETTTWYNHDEIRRFH